MTKIATMKLALLLKLVPILLTTAVARAITATEISFWKHMLSSQPHVSFNFLYQILCIGRERRLFTSAWQFIHFGAIAYKKSITLRLSRSAEGLGTLRYNTSPKSWKSLVFFVRVALSEHLSVLYFNIPHEKIFIIYMSVFLLEFL